VRTDTDIVRYYQRLVQSRRIGSKSELIPADHRVDWNDAPSKFTIRTGTSRVWLPPPLSNESLMLGSRPSSAQSTAPYRIDLADLSDFLFLTTGVLDRRIRVNWNLDDKQISKFGRAVYGRGTASGGGLYPISPYLIVNSRMAIPEGVYQYDDAHHALSRVRMGDHTRAAAAAIGTSYTRSADLLVVLTARFWKTAFKYHGFAYQVLAHDVGACVGSMEQVGYSLGWQLRIIYWFCDQMLASLLGSETDREAPMIVLAINRSVRDAEDSTEPSSRVANSARSRFLPRIQSQVYERSKRTFVPDLIRENSGRIYGAP